ncbi:MAG: response regulator transcription factor [Ignavibacteria bacterium]|nr:response regulator transcription factor [Ignavibacteria bacterium]MBI3766024.1 response regulator transcription factor [Ignavibacteriales bacterium]
MTVKRVLIIEDDTAIANLVEIHVKDLDCTVEKVADGVEGLKKALSGKHDLIILDLMLPGMSGLDVCKEIRAVNRTIPILMLTARSEEFDRVLGLELGADDYLTKPFGVRELVARVKAIFRRIDIAKQDLKKNDAKELRIGKLSIDPQKRRVILNSEKLELTAKEFDLLYLFMKNQGRAYSRQELLDVVWGYQFDGYDHTVNSHINRLRAKIETDPSKPKYILTVWGVGYRFAEQEEIASNHA